MSGVASLTLSALDARVLRATDPLRERTAERVAGIVGCSEDVAASCLRRLRGRMLVEVDGCPPDWLAAHRSRRCCAGARAVIRVCEGFMSLSANHVQADVCFGSQRVECAPAVRVPAAVDAACEAHVEGTQRNEELLLEISQINLELLRRRALE